VSTHAIDVIKDGGGVIKPGRPDAKLHSLSRDFPGPRRWTAAGALTFAGTAQNWKFVHSALSGETWSQAATKALAVAAARVEKQALVIEAKRQEPPPEAYRWQFKTKPYDHQSRAWYISREAEGFAYFMEMGTGKTKVIIDVAAYLYSIGEIDTLFIISKNGVHVQWLTEQVPLHMPEWTNYRCAPPLYTSLGKRDEAAVNETLGHKGLKVFSINRDALSSPNGEKRVASILLKTRALFAVDESTGFKNISAFRTKALMRLRKLARYRRIASGAPITKGVEDLYAQMMFISDDVFPVSSYAGFTSRYCKMGGYEGREVVGYQNLEDLQKCIDPYSYRVLKRDCLDLPEKVYEERIVDLIPEQRKMYKEMANDLLVEMQSGQMVGALNVAASLSKLQQITSGFLIDSEGKIAWRAEPNPRIKVLLDVIEEAGSAQAIVWCRFREDVEAVKAALKNATVSLSEYHGGLSSDEKEANKLDFVTGRSQVLIATQAADSGLNLQNAALAIYYSNSFDADFRWQSEDRIHRIGQKNTCAYVDLVAPKTIDAKIVRNLRDKKDLASSTLDDVKRLLSADDLG
jgi:superfamily II DNA or RNA helicase